MAFISASSLPSNFNIPSLHLMTAEAFDQLLTTIDTNAAWKDQAEAAYRLLQGQVQALIVENRGLREDAGALAAAFSPFLPFVGNKEKSTYFDSF